MTAAETLTAAAEKLRRLAEEATGGRWRVDECSSSYARDTETRWAILHGTGRDEIDVVTVDYDRDYGMPQGGIWEEANAAYIAAMHPTLGLLLADALEAEAKRIAPLPKAMCGHPFGGTNPHLLAIARELLNEGES